MTVRAKENRRSGTSRAVNMSATTTIADAYGEGACLYETAKGPYTVEREKKLYLDDAPRRPVRAKSGGRAGTGLAPS